MKNFQHGTLKTIAKEAECSPSTVSRVLNGRKKGFSVCPELETKIRNLAEKYHYRPNPFLRVMRAEKSNLIAVFDPLSNHSRSLTRMKAAFVEAIRKEGFLDIGKYVSLYRLETYSVPFPVAGALLFDVSEASFLKFLEEQRIPYAVLNGIAGPGGVSVRIDEEENIRTVVDGLVSAGHERIAFFGAHLDRGSSHQHFSGILREEAFRNELKRRNLPLPPEVFSEETSPEAFLRAVGKAFRPTAVVCYDPLRAMGIYAEAIRSGLRIPEDLSLVSMSDSSELELLPIPVAALSEPCVKMGEAAADAVFRLIAGELTPEEKSIRMKSRFLKRKSIAEPDGRTL